MSAREVTGAVAPAAASAPSGEARPSAVALVAAARRGRARRRRAVTAALLLAVVLAYVGALTLGESIHSPAEVVRVALGMDSDASFTIGVLRLPRASTAVLTGLAFGAAGTAFQTLLRNPLASPDVIGISSGASAAAVVGIVLLGFGSTAVSVVAMVAALVTALVIYALANRGGVAGSRLILIGIGVAAMLNSVVAYALSRAAQWDLQIATRWLTGNLNGSSWSALLPLAVVTLAALPLLLWCARDLEAMRLGEETATALGVRVGRTRLLLVVAAVALLAFATAAAGPISFVAFLAGPIAARILGPVGSPVLAGGLVGALLVLVADFLAQFAFGTRFPVGVVTGVLGAPYLVYLLVRTNRTGGSL
ncbi:FecCD family ABC transporter permease [Litorihabitans aurantiacus]|uniref:ABC transporter permease n=1 Tax=Litorihabitans aurantiacus TaxID=1930061 RepID=A0AA38CT16_9MICO|nr:iron chelate uptake ABC transporter family permease subunit [Litorihabitans aurantiacus]GMA31422.1 ABC transporter permease [Litorihabitans aurantiacus]